MSESKKATLISIKIVAASVYIEIRGPRPPSAHTSPQSFLHWPYPLFAVSDLELDVHT